MFSFSFFSEGGLDGVVDRFEASGLELLEPPQLSPLVGVLAKISSSATSSSISWMQGGVKLVSSGT